LLIGAVMILAIGAGVAFALLTARDETGLASPTPSPSPSAPAPTDEPSPTSSPTVGESPTGAPTATPEPTDAQPTPVVEAPDAILPSGSIARVLVDGLRVRSEPSADASLVETLVSGDLVAVGFSHLRGDWGPVEADGYSWYPVRPLAMTELPAVPSGRLEADDQSHEGGWVALGDGTRFLELVPARCTDAEPTVEILESLVPWERLACYGDRSLTLEGTFGCGGCGGMWPGTFEPAWLAFPFEFDMLSPDPSEQIGPFSLWFPETVQRPEAGQILRVTGHFDDPAARNCRVESGDPPREIDSRTAELYCRSRFVVETYEVIGVDEDFQTS
jgi:hypothetical protein